MIKAKENKEVKANANTNKVKTTVIVSILLLSVFTATTMLSVADMPEGPHVFWGNVTVDGAPAPDGTTVVAKIGGEVRGSTTTVAGTYGVHSYFDVTGTSGDNISFYVADVYATNYIFVEKGTTALDLSVISAISPTVTNPSASPATIPDDTDNDPRWGENSTLNVTVTCASNITSVTINLSAIGKSANQPMTNIEGNIWSVATNASVGTANWNGSAYVPHSLQVNATDEYGNSSTNVSINLTVVKNGDVSEDHDVDAADCTYLARHLATIPGYETMHDEVADVSGEGDVDAADCTYLARHLATIPGYEVLK